MLCVHDLSGFLPARRDLCFFFLVFCVCRVFSSSGNAYIHDVPQEPLYGQCPEDGKENLYLLKEHKAASSTLQNILLRYAEVHDVQVLLPKDGFSYNFPDKFNHSLVNFWPFSGRSPRFGCLHSRFSFESVRLIFPPKCSKYIAIIRDPVQHFISAFQYYHHLPVFNGYKTVDDFLRNASLHWPHVDTSRSENSQGRNGMAFDMGLDNNLHKVAPQTLRQLSHAFDLVLVSEYMHESLILLRDLMGWSLNDIVHLKLNSAKSKKVRSQTVNSNTVARIRSWNSLDSQLYDFFNHSFWEKVQAFGHDRMKRETTALDKLCREALKTCLQGQKSGPHQQQKLDSVGNNEEVTLAIPMHLRPFSPEILHQPSWSPPEVKIMSLQIAQNISGPEKHWCDRLTVQEITYLRHWKLWTEEKGRNASRITTTRQQNEGNKI